MRHSLTDLIKHPQDTYFVRHSDLILIIDRAALTGDRDLVIAKLQGRMFVTRLNLKTGGERIDFEVWGKVTYIVTPAERTE
jgi:hypothetical protein